MGLSFATHAMDTAGMMTLLYHQWLSESVRAFLADQLFPDGSTDVKEETGQWLQLLALLHDIGKVTPAFQNKIAPSLNRHAERLQEAGLEITCADAIGFRHSLAGFAILMEEAFPPEFGEIVGVHHGATFTRLEAEDDYAQHRRNYNGQGNTQ